MRWTSSLAALAGVLVACGGGGSGSPDPDGGTVDAGPDGAVEPPAPEPPAAPALPEPPDITCPTGWTERDHDGIVTCGAWPGGAPVECAAGEAHWPGTSGCERVGTACPEGDWADDLPEDVPIVYVKDGALALGADGSRDNPYGSVNGAIQVAPSGAVIALSKGTFTEPIGLGRRVTLHGACVEETILSYTDPDASYYTVGVYGTGVGLANLTVTGDYGGIVVDDTAEEVTLDSVVVRGTVGRGIVVLADARIRARGLVVTGVRTWPVDGPIGLEVAPHGSAVIERAWLDTNTGNAIVVQHDGALAATDLGVARTTGRDDGTQGEGLVVLSGSTATLDRAAFHANHAGGILVFGPDTTFVATDLAIEETFSRVADGEEGIGIQVSDEGDAAVTRASIRGNRGAGAVVFGGGILAMTDSIVAGTLPWTSVPVAGYGVEAYRGGSVTLTRVALIDNHDVGLLAFDAGTVAEGTDLTCRGTRAIQMEEQPIGYGAQAAAGASLALERAWLSGSEVLGLLVSGEGTRLDAADLTIEDTAVGGVDGEYGIGLQVQIGASAGVTRAALRGNRVTGLWVGEGATAEIADLEVLDTSSSFDVGLYGIGVGVFSRGSASVERVRVRGNRFVGAIAENEGARLTLTDLWIEATAGAACLETTCVDTAGGIGLAAAEGGAVEATTFRIVDNALCGVMVAEQGQMDLHRGEVSGHLIGANVADGSFDLDRLQDDVRYVDNDRTLDASSIPAPDIEDLLAVPETPR